MADPGNDGEEFQSTLSVRRATRKSSRKILGYIISIHALREESDAPIFFGGSYGCISIHALREESDSGRGGCDRSVDISIHALREESDLSVPLMWSGGMSISIHALREESDDAAVAQDQSIHISIHALREESDSISANRRAYCHNFNPRSP